MLGYILAVCRMLILILSLFITIAFGVVLKFLRILKQEHAFIIRTYWCRFVLLILGIKCRKEGNLALKSGTLYVSNHRSLIDPVVLFSLIKNGFAISKAEVQNYPLINVGANLSGVVYVNRNNKDSRHSAKSSIVATLNKGNSVLLFPEGTISVNRKILDFKKGGFEAAYECNAPVVPIALEYADPDRDFWFTDNIVKQFLISFSQWRTTVYLRIYEPRYIYEPLQDCSKIHELIQSQISEFQKNWQPEKIPKSLLNEV